MIYYTEYSDINKIILEMCHISIKLCYFTHQSHKAKEGEISHTHLYTTCCLHITKHDG